MSKAKLKLNAENLRAVVERYSNDIGLFGIEMLGLKAYDAWQLELHRLKLDTEKRRIAIKSCHNSGKTLNAVVLSYHHLLCYHNAQVIITSATGAQLFDAFGTKMSVMLRGSPIEHWFDLSATKAKLKGIAGSFVSLRTNSINNVESFQGIHTQGGTGGPLFIVDEASGVHDSILNAITNNLMEPYAKMILLGNPIIKTGGFYEAFNKNKSLFETITVSYKDTSFLDEQYINDKRIEYGEDSDEWRIRLLGEFPLSDVSMFNDEQDVDNAFARENVIDTMLPRIGGLDVGAKRDKSVLVVRQGLVATDVKEYDTDDPNVLQELVRKDMILLNIDCLAVDFNGIGWSVYKYLKDKINGTRVRGVELTNLSIADDKKYYNKRAKWWGLARDWIKQGGSITNNTMHQVMKEEAISLMEFKDGVGRIVLEKKEDAVKRNPRFHSPDHWDPLAYSFAVSDIVVSNAVADRIKVKETTLTNNVNLSNLF